MKWHMVGFRRVVQRPHPQPRGIHQWLSRPAAFRGAPVPVDLVAAWRRALPVEVDRPVREVGVESVPAEPLHAPQLRVHRREAFRQRRQVWDEDTLRLHVCQEAHAILYDADQPPVGEAQLFQPPQQVGAVERVLHCRVVVQYPSAARPPAREVPDESPCPWPQLRLADHQCVRSQPLAIWTLLLHAHEIRQRGLHPPLHAAPGMWHHEAESGARTASRPCRLARHELERRRGGYRRHLREGEYTFLLPGSVSSGAMSNEQ
eukprot:7389900-Prymnesium_polylepis.1